MRRAEHIDVVELEDRKTPKRAANVAVMNRAVRGRSVESLRGQRDAPRFPGRQLRRSHLPSPCAVTERRTGVRRSATLVAGSASVTPQRVAIQSNVAGS